MIRISVLAICVLSVGCKTTHSMRALPGQPLTVSVVNQEPKLIVEAEELLRFTPPESADPDRLRMAVSEGRWDQVRLLTQEQLRREPAHPKYFTYLAIAYAALGDLQNAQLYIDLILREDPQNAMALNLAGILTWRKAVVLEDYRRALALFNLAAQSQDQLYAPRLNMGYMYLRLGNLESALSEFEQTKKKCGDCLPALLGSAITAQRLSRFEQAGEDLKKLLAIDSDHPMANYLMGLQVRLHDKNVEKSYEWFERVLESPTADIELHERSRAFLSSQTLDDPNL
jgi:tetratricopeptide (TPR) repeat protein